MASVASQLIEEVTARGQSDSIEGEREICADGTYFPINLRTTLTRILTNYCVTRSRCCILCGPVGERVLDIIPGGKELETQVKTGSRTGSTHSQ